MTAHPARRAIFRAAAAALVVAVTLTAVGARASDDAPMVLVPAGAFTMGSDEYYPAERPHRVDLDAYFIDTYETTTARFRRFVEATGYRTMAERDGASIAWTGTTFDKVAGATWRAPRGPGSVAEPSHPVVQVTWFDAAAYCSWAGKRLPTEAEWEKAARGTDARRFPWGDQWDASRANSSDGARGGTAPVGSYPTGVSPYGVHDLAGNAWEWVADRYDSGYYSRSPERNPTGAEAGAERGIRGGGWYLDPVSLRAARRRGYPATARNDVIGFRCAKSP
jgi:formylglycine-generating enzyme required for sulfatase activity